ncbi:MAG: peptidyl-prolyl cis-trans isomerase [Chloroflexia bacterium]
MLNSTPSSNADTRPRSTDTRVTWEAARKRQLQPRSKPSCASPSELTGQNFEEVVRTQTGYSLAEFREQLRLNLLVQKLLASQITVTDAEIKTYYDANMQQFATPEQLTLQRVVTDDQDQAAAAARELQAQNADIAAVVTRHGSKQQGRAALNGDLGTITLDQLGPELGPVATTLAAGDVSDPIPLQTGGYAVIKVVARTGGDVPTLAQIRPQVVKTLQQTKINGSARVS